VGLLLGWGAFPAILTALTLQALLFQFGGITTLGVNTMTMALPALLCYYLFGRLLHKRHFTVILAAFACGAFSVFLASIMVGCALFFTEENFFKVSAMLVIGHLPVMAIEGIITALCVVFLKKVEPTLLPGYSARSFEGEPPAQKPASDNEESPSGNERGDTGSA
jgi:cobalt/nickel transport system permease protein